MGTGPRFAVIGGARVAYEVHEGGDGPDIVYSPGLASHLDMTYEQPRYRRYIDALCRYSRVIRFDRRGTGISDPAPDGASESWELWADDLGAVLDHVGSESAAIVATNDAGSAAMLFAATRPERVNALVLFNTTARFTIAEDYPQGHPAGVAEVRCPTLVVHRADYGTVPASQGRYLAGRIPTATYLEVPGADAPIYTQGTDSIVEAIGAFVGAKPSPPRDDRQFATVFFTDIVSSTRKAAELGDHAWHRALDDHDGATRAAVQAHGGRYIKSTGDGALATFDAASRAIQCAQAVRAGVRAIGLDVRAGLHAGPLLVRQDGDIGGLAVHAAARVLSCAGDGEVWVSSSVASLVTDPDIVFRDQGPHDLKGVPGAQQLLSVA